MMRRNIFLIIAALAGGAFISIAYVNPYEGSISLSGVILQITGSRGDFMLDYSMSALLTFFMKLLPFFLFQLYAGVQMYKQFCTASVYVFSRVTDRTRWYIKELFNLGKMTLLFLVLYLVSVLAVAGMRWDVRWTGTGFIVSVYYLLIYGFWLFAMTLAVNLLAVFAGSSSAFVVVFGGQALMLTLLGLLRTVPEQSAAFLWLIRLDPASRLVIGWQAEHFESVHGLFSPSSYGICLTGTAVYMLCAAALIGCSGGFAVKRKDVIISDVENGGAV